jgi:predicted ArsR family transcriptional regulator
MELITDVTVKSKFRILAAVREMQAANEPVTIKAVAEKVGLAGLSGVRAHLLALEGAGLIKWQRRGEKLAA